MPHVAREEYSGSAGVLCWNPIYSQLRHYVRKGGKHLMMCAGFDARTAKRRPKTKWVSWDGSQGTFRAIG
jgi:hypothetical protein